MLKALGFSSPDEIIRLADLYKVKGAYKLDSQVLTATYKGCIEIILLCILEHGPLFLHPWIMWAAALVPEVVSCAEGSDEVAQKILVNGLEPRPSRYEVVNSKPRRFSRTPDDPVTPPFHPPTRRSSRTRVPILAVVQSIQRKVPRPTRAIPPDQPASRGPRQPGPESCGSRCPCSRSCRPALRRDRDLLALHRPPRVDHAVLEDGGGVAEDEVHRAVDVALSVELALGVDVERVLVALDAALVEYRPVGVRSEGHRLVVLWTGGVAEGDAAGDESGAVHRCNCVRADGLGDRVFLIRSGRGLCHGQVFSFH
ncbi:unnamed protein product [Linum tenue]|uniref:Uncharacterized protein n=1 Tax=Linum tenue TaxID=586396 RepID=A0AAV0I8X0_9ROSI|nr:unnamed protein product [Linum tenue]